MTTDQAAEKEDPGTAKEPQDKEDVEGHRTWRQRPDPGDVGATEKGESQGDPPEHHK